MKNKIILLSAILIIACGPTKSKTEAVAATQISSAENLSKRIDDHFKEMQKLMEQQNLQHRKLMQEAFKDLDSKNAVTNKTSVKSNEDEENYYYELEFSGVKKEEINVALRENILTFSATQKVEKNNKFSGTNFYYSFAVRDFDKAAEVDIRRMDDRIIVKLKKKK